MLLWIFVRFRYHLNGGGVQIGLQELRRSNDVVDGVFATQCLL